MKTFAYVGALVLSFILGGVSTLVGFPRHHQVNAPQVAETIAPNDLMRGVGLLTETPVSDYY